MSKLLGILSLIATGGTLAGSFINQIKPSVGIIVLGITAAISAFTERVQGGKSKVEPPSFK